jgi:hypothetical protein
MTEPQRLVDYVTGREVADVGPEANRQAVERFLVDSLGYLPEAIEVDAPIAFEVENVFYRSRVDLVVWVKGVRYMAIKCAAGSLGSREREILAAARLLGQHQLPLAVVSDGSTAIVLETASGKKLGQGLSAIPSRQAAEAGLNLDGLVCTTDDRRRKERLIFRSYDAMNVNRWSGE